MMIDGDIIFYSGLMLLLFMVIDIFVINMFREKRWQSKCYKEKEELRKKYARLDTEYLYTVLRMEKEIKELKAENSQLKFYENGYNDMRRLIYDE